MRKVTLFFLFTLMTSFHVNGNEYKGAEYRTKEAFIYGRFEVCYRPANREGVVSSFFTYHDFTSQTGWNEIDLEIIGRYSNSVQFNTITPGQRFHIRSNHTNFDPYIDFHEYAFEWTPNYVAWFIDGEEVYKQTGEHIQTLIYPQKIMMNIWNPIYKNWVGYWKDEYLPAVSVYDWVQYSSYTPGSGNYGTENNFSVEWKDDFDSFDESRWEKESHTFPGNLADFIPENVIFKEGKLHLFLTDKTDLGGIDNISPKIVWSRANYDSTISIKFSEEINKESAENIENYILTGGKVKKAILEQNEVYVKLITSGYNPYTSNNLIYKNIRDKSPNGNQIGLTVSILHPVEELSFPIKINIGGDELSEYKKDQEWSPTTNYGYWMGDKRTWPQNTIINGTSTTEIFLTERKGLINYFFKVPNGQYNLKLLFSENDNNKIGDRVFNIYAENEVFQNNIDIFSLVGKNTVYVLEKEIQVNDEIITLHFEESIDSAFVNAIIVDKVLTSVENNFQSNFPNEFKLFQNYPNPFNPVTKISYNVVRKANISLDVFNIIGKKVKTLINETKYPGNYSLNFDASLLPSGVYFYRLTANGNPIETKKMIILK